MGNIELTWLVKDKDGKVANRCKTREVARHSKRLLNNAWGGHNKFSIERVGYIIVSRKVVS